MEHVIATEYRGIPRSKWNRCVVCGKAVHPMQETSAAPLAEGICCVSCSFGRVWPTRRNNGIPSHLVTERNREGKLITRIVADAETMQKRRKNRKADFID